jgi:hypothetical protein
MDVRDTPTIVLLDKEPVSKVVKNRHAKTIIELFKKAGYSQDRLSLRIVK